MLAVYRKEALTATERVLVDGFASQIAARLWNHRLYGKTLERARLSEIVTHTSDGVFTVDPDGLIRSWNPAMHAIVGYSEDEAIGERCEELLGLGMITVLAAERRRRRPARRHDGHDEGRRDEGAPAPDEHDPRRRGRPTAADRRRARRRRGDEGRADQAGLRLDGLPRAPLPADAAPRVPHQPGRGHRRRRARQASGVLPDHAPPGPTSRAGRQRHARCLDDRGRRPRGGSPADAARTRAQPGRDGVPGAALGSPGGAARPRPGDDRVRRSVPRGADRAEPALERGQVHAGGAADHGRHPDVPRGRSRSR